MLGVGGLAEFAESRGVRDGNEVSKQALGAGLNGEPGRSMSSWGSLENVGSRPIHANRDFGPAEGDVPPEP